MDSAYLKEFAEDRQKRMYAELMFWTMLRKRSDLHVHINNHGGGLISAHCSINIDDVRYVQERVANMGMEEEIA